MAVILFGILGCSPGGEIVTTKRADPKAELDALASRLKSDPEYVWELTVNRKEKLPVVLEALAKSPEDPVWIGVIGMFFAAIRGRFDIKLAYLSAVAYDLVLVPTLVAFTGGLSSPFYLLLFMNVAVAAYVLRFWVASSITLLTALALVAACYRDLGLANLPDFSFDERGFRIGSNQTSKDEHRHFSNLLLIYPLIKIQKMFL